MHITFDFIDFSDVGLLESKLVEGRTKLIWLESPSNPTLKISDIAASASLAHKYGAMLAVDNTFCSPYLQNPLGMGADVVVHSVSEIWFIRCMCMSICYVYVEVLASCATINTILLDIAFSFISTCYFLLAKYISGHSDW